MATRKPNRRKKKRGAGSSRPDRRVPVLMVLGLIGLVLLYAGWSDEPDEVDGEPLSGGNLVRIEVRNGCGVSGVAAEIRRELIDLGQRTGFEIDVVGTENADDFLYEETILVDFRSDARRTRRLSRLIGCDAVVQSVDLSAYPDYQLIIGKDHEELKWKR